MHAIAPELLAHASPEELAAYHSALQRQLALSSPLDFAQAVSPATARFPHIVLLNDVVTKLLLGRLFHPGTSPHSVPPSAARPPGPQTAADAPPTGLPPTLSDSANDTGQNPPQTTPEPEPAPTPTPIPTPIPIRKLAVSMPPRHGKSFLLSHHLPAWAIARWGHLGLRVGLAAYEADFAATWGRKARDIIEAHGERFGLRLDNSSHAAAAWDLIPQTKGGPQGGMNTAGAGGPFTGKGFHVLIVDDPVKNAEWAMSETIRNKQYDWLGSTALTRMEPAILPPAAPGAGSDPAPGPPGPYAGISGIILVNTRWHEDDLMGRVLRDEPDEWYHLNLKALADDDAPASDPLGRQPGEALCPPRFPAAALNKIKSSPTTGGYWWGAMYQGTPRIEGGGIFKRSGFRHWRYGAPAAPGASEASEAPGSAQHYVLQEPSGEQRWEPVRGCPAFCTLDLAATQKKLSDFNVLATWVVLPDRRLLLADMVREKMDSADHAEWVQHHYARLAGPDNDGPLRPSYIGVENTTYGLTLITQLRRLSIPFKALKTRNEDKISRAFTAGALMDAGRIWFPDPAGGRSGAYSWVLDMQDELLGFPTARHDDRVDVLAYAALELAVGPWSAALRPSQALPDNSIEARIERALAARARGRRGRRHPELGRLR